MDAVVVTFNVGLRESGRYLQRFWAFSLGLGKLFVLDQGSSKLMRIVGHSSEVCHVDGVGVESNSSDGGKQSSELHCLILIIIRSSPL